MKHENEILATVGIIIVIVLFAGWLYAIVNHI